MIILNKHMHMDLNQMQYILYLDQQKQNNFKYLNHIYIFQQPIKPLHMF